MFIAALFTIAKIQRQPKYSTTHDWIKKLSTHTMEYYSAIEKNEILPFATICMNLEGVMLNEMSDRETQIPHDLTYMQKFKFRCPVFF